MAKGSKGAGKSLVRANLAIHEPPVGDSMTPGGIIETFAFDFNPSQLSLSRRALWTATPAQIERTGAKPEFMGVEAMQMGLEIFLDSSDKPTGNTVLKKVESLLDCCEVTLRSIGAKKPSPPWVVFQWGRSRRCGSPPTSAPSTSRTRCSAPPASPSGPPPGCS